MPTSKKRNRRPVRPVLGFRLDPTQRAQLLAIAKEEERSISNLVSYALARFIRERATKDNNVNTVPATENFPSNQPAA